MNIRLSPSRSGVFTSLPVFVNFSLTLVSHLCGKYKHDLFPMKFKSLLLYSAVVLTLGGCIQNDIPDPVIPPVVTPPTPYSITEDFESGTKTAYATDSVQLNTGKWTFSDALIGTLATDAKNGVKSVRLRTGYLRMNFDVAGLTTLYVKHAKFGGDAPSTWQLLMSTDGGKTYSQLGTNITETSEFVLSKANDLIMLILLVMPGAIYCNNQM